jgi:hypothetical protein
MQVWPQGQVAQSRSSAKIYSRIHVKNQKDVNKKYKTISIRQKKEKN